MIIECVDWGGVKWWTNDTCEHCHADIRMTANSSKRPWICNGCTKAIQSFDSPHKANIYFSWMSPNTAPLDRAQSVGYNSR